MKRWCVNDVNEDGVKTDDGKLPEVLDVDSNDLN